MASTALSLVNGVPRQQSITVALPLIYDQVVNVVASGATPPSSINSPVTTGTAVNLPGGGSFTINSNSVPNLEIFLNGVALEYLVDWAVFATPPTYTAVAFTFNLVTGDEIVFRILRNS